LDENGTVPSGDKSKEIGGVPRRTVVKGAAWSIPVIATAVALPSASASGPLRADLVIPGGGCVVPGTALADPAATVVVTDTTGPVAGATVQLVFTSVDGGSVVHDGQTYPGSSVVVQGVTDATGRAEFTGFTAGTVGTVTVLASVQTADGRRVESNPGSFAICQPAGNVFVWGWNAEGQVGNTTQTASRVPVPTPWEVDKTFTSVAGSWSTLAAVSTENTVYASGHNGMGGRGDGTFDTTTPDGRPSGPAYALTNTSMNNTERTAANAASFPVFTSAQSMVSAQNGNNDTAMLVWGTDGLLYGTGENAGDYYATGNGTDTFDRASAFAGYVQVGKLILDRNPGTRIVQADIAGWWHSVYLLSDGTVWSAGRNHQASFGSGTTPPVGAQGPEIAYQAVTADGTPLTGIVDVRTTQDSAVFLAADGRLWAAGRNSYGQLPGMNVGAVSNVAIELTAPVPGVPVTRIWKSGADGESIIVLLADGRVFAAGNNTSGQLGIGTTADTRNRWVQIPLPEGKSLKEVALGNDGGLYLMTDGSVYFAGANDTGGLGNGTLGGVVTTLTQVPLAGPASSIAATYWDTYAAVV